MEICHSHIWNEHSIVLDFGHINSWQLTFFFPGSFSHEETSLFFTIFSMTNYSWNTQFTVPIFVTNGILTVPTRASNFGLNRFFCLIYCSVHIKSIMSNYPDFGSVCYRIPCTICSRLFLPKKDISINHFPLEHHVQEPIPLLYFWDLT